MTTEAKSDLQILKDAREIIINNGWSQIDRESPDGSHCAIGAIEHARYGECVVDSDRGYYDPLAEFLFTDVLSEVDTSGSYGQDYGTLWGWNDSVAKSSDEVIALFDLAIEKMEKFADGPGA